MITRFRLEGYKKGASQEIKEAVMLELSESASEIMKSFRLQGQDGLWECTDDVVSAHRSNVDGMSGRVIGYRGRMVFTYRGTGESDQEEFHLSHMAAR